METNRDEIAKLEALYAANPEGRVFTHLAEAYRKGGLLDRAREILDSGLARHTDYPSAHVVLGRVLLDAGDEAGAASAFRRVLELDRHNLIALRALAELATEADRPAEALHYYRELAALDPGNDEIGQLIRDLSANAEREGDAPVGEAWSAGAAGAEVDGVEVDEPPEPGDYEDVSYGLTGGQPTDRELPAGDWVPQDRWDRFAEPAITEADWDREPAGEPASDESAGEQASDEFAGEQASHESAGDEEIAQPELVDITDEEPSPIEIHVTSVEAVLIAADDAADLAVEPATEPLDRESETADDAREPLDVASELAGDTQESLDLAAERPDEMVTETMAEVYAAQGLTERAVEVYRQLLRLRPHDDRIAARLVELEEILVMPAGEAEAPAGEEREAWLQKVESAWTGGDGAVDAGDDTLYAWPQSRQEEEGPDVRRAGDYFRALLAWRPAGAPPVEPDRVDTGAGSFGFQAEPAPEAVTDELLLVDEIEPPHPAVGSGSAAGSVEAAFDEWFGPDPVAAAEPPLAMPRPAAPLADQVEGTESEEDLEMFRTWLQSLKK
ncbi:MAG: tetratricopeptide repeat protein [Longimicrobiales bacterium]